MCVQCSAQLRGLRCAASCTDVMQCSFACASMLTLSKPCENSGETSSGCGGHEGGISAAAPAPSLSCRCSPTWTSRHSNKDPPHFPSPPLPSSLFLCPSTAPFSPQSVDLCHAALIPVTVLPHITHTPAICMLRRGPSTAEVRAESLLSLTAACRLKFPLPLQCCMHGFFCILFFNYHMWRWRKSAAHPVQLWILGL